MSRLNLLEALTDNIVVNPDKCVFCGKCVDVCVLDNLRMKLSPCRAACPLGVNCQAYIRLIARGNEKRAYEVLCETLPFPGILSHICSRPCETNCHRKIVTGEAVAVRTLKRYLYENNSPPSPVAAEEVPETGKKIAIIGSGPAGLMAAHDLRARGHGVTVFDSASEPGGMLRWAIPEFRLPVKVLDGDLERLRERGVDFKCGVTVDDIDKVRGEYDAVILATGCGRHVELGIEGEDLEGVYHGLQFLRSVRAGNAPELIGKTVVIGGGNVAIDAAQTALRLDAESVTVVSLERFDDLPAFPESVGEAVDEGIVFDCSWGPLRITGDNKKVSGIELRRCVSVFDASGAFNPKFDVCMTKVLDADAVIVAIGQNREATMCDIDSMNVDPLILQAVDNLFIAGDFYGGPSSVVEAMASGRAAVESVDRYLRGEHLKYGREYGGPVELSFDIDISRGSGESRVSVQRNAFRGKGDFGVTDQCVGREQARTEAARCYSCGAPYGKFRSCWFCLPCEVECPEEALWVEIPYLLR